MSFISILKPWLTMKPLFGILPGAAADEKEDCKPHSGSEPFYLTEEQNGFSAANCSVQPLCHILGLNIGICISMARASEAKFDVSEVGKQNPLTGRGSKYL